MENERVVRTYKLQMLVIDINVWKIQKFELQLK